MYHKKGKEREEERKRRGSDRGKSGRGRQSYASCALSKREVEATCFLPYVKKRKERGRDKREEGGGGGGGERVGGVVR